MLIQYYPLRADVFGNYIYPTKKIKLSSEIGPICVPHIIEKCCTIELNNQIKPNQKSSNRRRMLFGYFIRRWMLGRSLADAIGCLFVILSALPRFFYRDCWQTILMSLWSILFLLLFIKINTQCDYIRRIYKNNSGSRTNVSNWSLQISRTKNE